MTAIEFSKQLINLERSLLKYALRLKLNGADAKDLVQETFLKVLLSRDKFVNKGYFKAWTFTIMKNTFISDYRRITVQNTYNNIDQSYFSNPFKTSGVESPESAYSVVEIAQNIEQLNEKFRVPLKMYIEGYKYKEIAETLNLKIGTVKCRIFLSRKQLKNQLAK
jgi:RNA polymerase sigma-70 factor, ECF subfamily